MTLKLFSLNFSSKSPWCSPVPLKFESYNLHHCKKNCCKLVFLVFTEQLLYQNIFGQPHCYEVTLLNLSWWRSLSYRNQSIDFLRRSMDWFLYDNGLLNERIKKCNKPLLEKNETKVSYQIGFIKNLLKISDKNNLDVSRINQIMSKLLKLSKLL